MFYSTLCIKFIPLETFSYLWGLLFGNALLYMDNSLCFSSNENNFLPYL